MIVCVKIYSSRQVIRPEFHLASSRFCIVHLRLWIIRMFSYKIFTCVIGIDISNFLSVATTLFERHVLVSAPSEATSARVNASEESPATRHLDFFVHSSILDATLPLSPTSFISWLHAVSPAIPLHANNEVLTVMVLLRGRLHTQRNVQNE
jgi:hypothetical protein